MPGGDRTGPRGLGSMTGRGAGFCAGYNTPGYMNPVGPSGFYGRGGGRGGGWGYRNMFYATGQPGWMRDGYQGYGPAYGQVPQYSKEDEIRSLKEQAEYFKKSAEDINARLNELAGEE